MPKRSLLLSARGWRTSRDKFCVVFLFCSGVFGLAWKPGGAGILFFLPGLYGKAAFLGEDYVFFLPFLLLPLMYIQILYSRLVWVYNFFILF